jgi:uncharacterized Tic20 family protein
MSTSSKQRDNTAVLAEAFFIANLLFVGFFYVALWILYFCRYQKTTTIGKVHLSQSLIASSISTTIFCLINVIIILTDGYASLTSLFSLEVYFMLIVPFFMIAGILGFTKAIKGISFNYPLIGRYSNE